jgi:hypothetical protein
MILCAYRRMKVDSTLFGRWILDRCEWLLRSPENLHVFTHFVAHGRNFENT